MIYQFNYLSNNITLRILEEEGFIVSINFYLTEETTNTADESESPLIKKAYNQLLEYFQGRRKDFDLPLKPRGTRFQLAVWSALLTIPYGETKSYKDIADAIGNPKAYRAVGSANNKNPIAILIPCHRVINSDGKMGGYSGGLEIKNGLLELEKKIFCQELH